MKLRNKKTGEIGRLHCDMNVSPAKYGVFEDADTIRGHYWEYHSLAELNKEWEDYEEPKDFWYINEVGGIVRLKPATRFDFHGNKEIGNYFETLKEAKKAVEKLKAWKRLKDNGFKFTGWDRHPDFPGDFRITASDEYTCDDKDLDLLFGGEE